MADSQLVFEALGNPSDSSKKNKYIEIFLRKFSYFIMLMYAVCTH